MNELLIRCRTADINHLITLMALARHLEVEVITVSTIKDTDVLDLVASLDDEARHNAIKAARKVALTLLTKHPFWPIKEYVHPDYANKTAALLEVGFLCGKQFGRMSDITAGDLSNALGELRGIEWALEDWTHAKASSEWKDQPDEYVMGAMLQTTVMLVHGRPRLSHDRIRHATRELVRRAHEATGTVIQPKAASKPPPIDEGHGTTIADTIAAAQARARNETPGQNQERPRASLPPPVEREPAPLMTTPSLLDDADDGYDEKEAWRDDAMKAFQ